MESSTVLTGFRFSGIPSNHLSSTNSVRDCPAIAENLSQVSDTTRGDVQRNRTNRCFFVSITHHECRSVNYSSGSSATNTAAYLNNGIRDNSFNKHVLFGGVIQLQNHTGNDRFSRVHSETGFTCGSNCGAKHNVREQCRLSKVAVLSLQSSFRLQVAGKSKQRCSTIRHKPSDHAAETEFGQVISRL